MVVQVLAIVNRGAFDLIDRFIDFGEGVIFFSIHPAGPSPTLQVSPSVAQIGEGVQVGRMPSWIVCKG
jgi:hypothetical protein